MSAQRFDPDLLLSLVITVLFVLPRLFLPS